MPYSGVVSCSRQARCALLCLPLKSPGINSEISALSISELGLCFLLSLVLLVVFTRASVVQSISGAFPRLMSLQTWHLSERLSVNTGQKPCRSSSGLSAGLRSSVEASILYSSCNKPHTLWLIIDAGRYQVVLCRDSQRWQRCSSRVEGWPAQDRASMLTILRLGRFLMLLLVLGIATASFLHTKWLAFRLPGGT